MSARGDDPDNVRAAAEKMAPDDARIEIVSAGASTTVRITVDERISMPLLDQIPPVHLRAEAVSANEESTQEQQPSGASP